MKGILSLTLLSLVAGNVFGMDFNKIYGNDEKNKQGKKQQQYSESNIHKRSHSPVGRYGDPRYL